MTLEIHSQKPKMKSDKKAKTQPAKQRSGRARNKDELLRLTDIINHMALTFHEKIHEHEKFSADVTHEIKNPLASLNSAVSTLKIATDPRQRDLLIHVIEQDIYRLNRLVNDMTEAFRLDNALLKEEETAVDLCDLLEKLCRNINIQAQEREIEILTDFPPEPQMVKGIERRLLQVFSNLTSNALSFCESGDAIRVWVRRRHERILAVVEDTGPGIPKHSLKKIFDRFYSERSENEFGNNSGLGLSISRHIIDAHGGAIWAENIHPTALDSLSEPLGARFIVALPILE